MSATANVGLRIHGQIPATEGLAASIVRRIESSNHYFFNNSNIASPAAWPMRVYQMALPR